MADPRARLARLRDGLTPREWGRAGAMTLTVVGLNVAGWAMLAVAVSGHFHISRTETFGFTTGILAYTLGMRHAFDADHIAAIDNTTRKLVSDGKRPLSVGFFFSLGHSSVVFILALALNFGIRALNEQVRNSSSHLQYTTNIIGTLVSGIFLFLIAAINVVILAGIVRVFRGMRTGQYDDEALDEQLNKRGLMNRILGPLARRIDAPWKMYPIGFLFGLGFDTASEVALLVLAGTAVIGGLPFYAVLSLPILFAAGMSLFDTADGCFMNFAYDWAFARPVRKVYYNLTITGLSVFVAAFIGVVEVLGLLGQDGHLTGPGWAWLEDFNINQAGFVIAGVFVLTWVVALAIWRFGKIEQKWDRAALDSGPGDPRARRSPVSERPGPRRAGVRAVDRPGPGRLSGTGFVGVSRSGPSVNLPGARRTSPGRHGPLHGPGEVIPLGHAAEQLQALRPGGAPLRAWPRRGEAEPRGRLGSRAAARRTPAGSRRRHRVGPYGRSRGSGGSGMRRRSRGR